MKFRVGFGSDTHPLQEGKELIIGGVKIPHYKGSVGHSDADVLIHAICDACLGAAGLRDIGTHFPDDQEVYQGIESKILLERTVAIIEKEGWKIVNIDSTIHLEKPKISEFIPGIKKILSEVLGIDLQDIAIKAKTSEKLGFVGREEGIRAEAIILIQSEK